MSFFNRYILIFFIILEDFLLLFFLLIPVLLFLFLIITNWRHKSLGSNELASKKLWLEKTIRFDSFFLSPPPLPETTYPSISTERAAPIVQATLSWFSKLMQTDYVFLAATAKWQNDARQIKKEDGKLVNERDNNV